MTMCVNSSSTQQLSPESSSLAGSRNAEKKVPYQNVTLASEASEASSGLFQMEDKKAESQEQQLKKKRIKTASLVSLSGGCVVNLMAQETNIIIHHHHHHFHPIEKPPTMRLENIYGNLLSNIHKLLNDNKYLLEQSGWYYGNLNQSQSSQLLSRTHEGTFIVRDSSHSRFLFTLSVQRKIGDGPTSVRIYFSHGKFRLDADEQIEHLMPQFDSVLDLIQYYCSLSKNNLRANSWIDSTGSLYSPICLKKPLRKNVPSLAHAARLAVHRSLKSQADLNELNMPKRITNYLSEYPFVM